MIFLNSFKNAQAIFPRRQMHISARRPTELHNRSGIALLANFARIFVARFVLSSAVSMGVLHSSSEDRQCFDFLLAKHSCYQSSFNCSPQLLLLNYFIYCCWKKRQVRPATWNNSYDRWKHQTKHKIMKTLFAAAFNSNIVAIGYNIGRAR